MAIRRCPYCKAIIDEGSEYCSNCGTQLLFPEDENIQEEIPGEEIVDEENQEESPKKKKAFSRRRKKEEEEEEPVSEEEREEMKEEPEEEIGQEEIAAEMLKKAEMEDTDRPDEEDIQEEQIEEEVPAEEELTVGNFGLPPGKGRDEYFVEEDKEASIKTEDLEKIVDPEEKEKAEIEKFLKSLKEDRSKWGSEIPPTDELPPWAEEIKEKQPEEEKSQDFVEPEEEHPAVEETVEESSPFEEEPLPAEEEQEEEIQEEDISDQEELHPDEGTPEEATPDVELPIEEIQERTPPEEEISMPDTSMGLPEGVEQERLPFDEKPAEVFKEEKISSARLPNWVKSRAFDVLFIAAMWIVTLHIASRMMATNLFRLISVAILPVFAFYLALLGVYLFLFFLFLGQTLGDHLFPHEE